MKKANIIILSLIAIIVIMTLVDIFNDDNNVVVTNDYQTEIQTLESQITEYEKTVSILTGQVDSLSYEAVLLVRKSDSLEQVKTKVKNIYHEIYIDINTASNKQLDSIIRSNW